MKKLALTLAIVLTMGLGAYAQYDEDKFGIQPWFGSSLLGRDGGTGTGYDGTGVLLPGHNFTTHWDGNEQGYDDSAPIGSGALLLVGFGAAYAMMKRKKEE